MQLSPASYATQHRTFWGTEFVCVRPGKAYERASPNPARRGCCWFLVFSAVVRGVRAHEAFGPRRSVRAGGLARKWFAVCDDRDEPRAFRRRRFSLVCGCASRQAWWARRSVFRNSLPGKRFVALAMLFAAAAVVGAIIIAFHAASLYEGL